MYVSIYVYLFLFVLSSINSSISFSIYFYLLMCISIVLLFFHGLILPQKPIFDLPWHSPNFSSDRGPYPLKIYRQNGSKKRASATTRTVPVPIIIKLVARANFNRMIEYRVAT